MFNPQDLYLKISDPSGKCPPIVCYHRVWDRDKFLSAQLELYSKKFDTDDFRVVTPVDEGAYRKAHGYKVAS